MNKKSEIPSSSEEEILANIISTGLYETNQRGNDVVTLRYGKKDLIIVIDKDNWTIGTRVENVRESGRQENETTLLYGAGKRVMEQYARKYNHNFVYTVKTSSEEMNAWVQKKGQSIYEFNPISDIKDRFRYHYQTTIFPRE